MQDVELSVNELHRIKEIGLNGVQIGSNIEDENLNEPKFFPIWEACEKLDLAVLVHPWNMMGKKQMERYWLPWLVGMPAETSRAMCSMIFGGIFDKFPNLRVNFCHASGSFLSTIGRIEHGFNCKTWGKWKFKYVWSLDAKKELDRFISKYFGSYEILDEEKGIIPMSSNLPEQASVKNWVNIGTRAGNVKPSTGYAFKNMYRHAQLICEGGNIKSKKVKPNKRFLFYDQLLLIILTVWPLKGKPIFERLFEVKSSYFILRFLDEKTSFFEDLSMFYKLQIGVFIKSIFYWIYWKFKKIIFPLLIIIYVIFDHSSPSAELLNLSSNNLYVLTLGLLFIGIPHGALDHLTGSLDNNTKINVKFVFYYLLMMIPILLIWFWIPVLGLIFFLI